MSSAHAFSELVDLIARLRAPDGCPWDRKQTPATFKHYLQEETQELLEALDHDDRTHIREELGDLLFQVLFLARLYQEEEAFSLEEVIQEITAKMIRRHPHVFGQAKVASEADLRRQWEKIKAGEKAAKQRDGA